jgi:hypothetical protein
MGINVTPQAVDVSTKANIDSPSFTGTVVLPATSSIGDVSNTEIAYVDGLTSNAQTQLNSKATKTLVIERKTASYVGEATDNNKLIEMNVGSACTYTVNSSIFSAGDQVLVSQYGAGQVTFVAGSGVTSRSASGKLKLTGQYSMATIIFLSASEFYVAGDLTA